MCRRPAELEGGSHVQFGDSMCSVGGWNMTKGAAVGGVVCWNPLGRSEDTAWVEMSRMASPRYMPGATVMDGKLFVAGGYDPRTHQ